MHFIKLYIVSCCLSFMGLDICTNTPLHLFSVLTPVINDPYKGDKLFPFFITINYFRMYLFIYHLVSVCDADFSLWLLLMRRNQSLEVGTVSYLYNWACLMILRGLCTFFWITIFSICLHTDLVRLFYWLVYFLACAFLIPIKLTS